MISSETKQTALPWLPAIFCAALAVITICGNVWLSFVNQTGDSQGASLVFFGSMPMCFVFMGFGVASLQREVVKLRSQVMQLQAEKSSP